MMPQQGDQDDRTGSMSSTAPQAQAPQAGKEHQDAPPRISSDGGCGEDPKNLPKNESAATSVVPASSASFSPDESNSRNISSPVLVPEVESTVANPHLTKAPAAVGSSTLTMGEEEVLDHQMITPNQTTTTHVDHPPPAAVEGGEEEDHINSSSRAPQPAEEPVLLEVPSAAPATEGPQRAPEPPLLATTSASVQLDEEDYCQEEAVASSAVVQGHKVEKVEEQVEAEADVSSLVQGSEGTTPAAETILQTEELQPPAAGEQVLEGDEPEDIMLQKEELLPGANIRSLPTPQQHNMAAASPRAEMKENKTYATTTATYSSDVVEEVQVDEKIASPSPEAVAPPSLQLEVLEQVTVPSQPAVILTPQEEVAVASETPTAPGEDLVASVPVQPEVVAPAKVDEIHAAAAAATTAGAPTTGTAAVVEEVLETPLPSVEVEPPSPASGTTPAAPEMEMVTNKNPANSYNVVKEQNDFTIHTKNTEQLQEQDNGNITNFQQTVEPAPQPVLSHQPEVVAVPPAPAAPLKQQALEQPPQQQENKTPAAAAPPAPVEVAGAGATAPVAAAEVVPKQATTLLSPEEQEAFNTLLWICTQRTRGGGNKSSTKKGGGGGPGGAAGDVTKGLFPTSEQHHHQNCTTSATGTPVAAAVSAGFFRKAERQDQLAFALLELGKRAYEIYGDSMEERNTANDFLFTVGSPPRGHNAKNNRKSSFGNSSKNKNAVRTPTFLERHCSVGGLFDNFIGGSTAPDGGAGGAGPQQLLRAGANQATRAATSFLRSGSSTTSAQNNTTNNRRQVGQHNFGIGSQKGQGKHGAHRTNPSSGRNQDNNFCAQHHDEANYCAQQ
ncbi:unnamed protein product [Amoebophrya sp. A120]|nr:unnamed protein product [Amoebophrya sp. A120]|eukprot:GSA120T00016170001.1